MLRSLAVLVALSLLAPGVRAQGLLSQARAEMDGPSKPKDTPEQKKPHDSSSGSSEASDNPAGALALLLLPFVVPNALLETIRLQPTFSDYPYSDAPAFMRSLGHGEAMKPWSLRVGAEEGNNFDGLNRVGLRAWLDAADSRFGLTTNWDHYYERLPCGCHDEFVVGDLMATYRFVQAERVQMHAGLGARGVFDGYRSWGGVNALYSADVFPVEPIVLSAQAEAGTLKESITCRFRATAGVQLRHAEFFAGYDWLRIGSVDLRGPMVGLRLWF